MTLDPQIIRQLPVRLKIDETSKGYPTVSVSIDDEDESDALNRIMGTYKEIKKRLKEEGFYGD
jgi:hypothetical protein